MRYTLVIIFWSSLITSETDCRGTSNHSFPHITKQPPQHIYALPNEQIFIPCEIECLNCSEQGRTRWEKSGSEVVNTIHSKNNTLIIDSYKPSVHNGSYICIVTYKTLSVRSLQCHVQTAVSPKFSIESDSTVENGTAVLKCVEPVSSIMEKLQFLWFKNGKQLKADKNVVIRDVHLFIKKVHLSDAGKYACWYKWKINSTFTKSRTVFLNVTLTPVTVIPSITMIAPQHRIQENDSVVVDCVAGGPPNADVRIFKLNEDQDIEIKLRQGKGFASLQVPHFSKEHEGKYICETEVAHMRRRRKMTLNLIDEPRLAHNGISHINTKTRTRVSFSCSPNSKSDVSVTWYHNTAQIKESNFFAFDGVWMSITDIRMMHSGIYQCIVENQYGADMKIFYLTVGKSGLAPLHLQIEKLAPDRVKLKWSPPKNAKLSQIFYTVYWFAPDGRQRNRVTTSTEFEITNGLYGGLNYKFEVCTFFTAKLDVKDCVDVYAPMLEATPLRGPALDRPIHTIGQEVTLIWKPIPIQFAQGIIQNYTVYCNPFFGKKRIKEIHHFNGNTTSAKIHLNGSGTYKIWIVAKNNAGQSPNSSSYIISTEENWNAGSGQIKFTVRFFIHPERGAKVHWKMLNINESVTGFRIFYVEIPYTDYWSSVSTVNVSRNVDSYTVLGLPLQKKYRFTMAPVYKWKEGHQKLNRLGKRTDAILHRSSYFKRHLESEIFQHDTVEKPSNFDCRPMNLHSILISWDPPSTKFKITDYVVNILNERTNVEINYSTTDDFLTVHNLTDVWYAVRVRANNYHMKNLTYFEAGYISCRTRVKVPTAPLSQKYEFFHSRKDSDHMRFMRIKWKPPVYTGNSVYSYNIRMVEESTGLWVQFPFEMNFYHLIMERQTDEWIRSPAIWVKGFGLILKVEISAINAAGEGEALKFETVETRPIPQIKTTSLTKPESHSSEGSPITLGVVVGLAVSAIFILVFVVVCILRDPCRSAHRTGNSSRDDAYLYLERLKDLETSSSAPSTVVTSYSECSGDSRKSKFSSKVYRGYKLLNPFKRRPKRRVSRGGGEDIMLSSSSSCSCYSRRHFIDRSQCDQHCVCNNSIYASASSASEEKESPDSIPESCSYKATASECTNIKPDRDGRESLLLDASL